MLIPYIYYQIRENVFYIFYVYIAIFVLIISN